MLRRRFVWTAFAAARTTQTASLRCHAHAQPEGHRSRGAAHQQGARGAAALAAVACPEVQAPAQPVDPPRDAPQQLKQQQMYCLVKNEEVLPCSMPSGAWLEAAPRGAYTTARTVGGGTSVFELSFHIDRLASSAALMMQADTEAAAAVGGAAAQGAASPAAAAAAGPSAVGVDDIVDAKKLRPRLLSALWAAVQGYRSASGDSAGELKLTVLVTWTGRQPREQQQGERQAAGGASSGSGDGSTSHVAPAHAISSDIYVHASPLPPRPQPPVRVVMRGAPRQNAAAKDSEWVRQRKALERGLPAGVNEVVLVGDGGALYEGLTSNFFAVMDGAVYTAGEGILAGTVREVALAVARREGIPVVLEPPRLADLPRWEGCFISSTSRLLLPVDEASLFREEEEGGEEGAGGERAGLSSTRSFERGGLVQRLEQLVLAEVEACSEPLA